MSQNAYSKAYEHHGESLKYQSNYERKYKPYNMSSNNWRGTMGNKWRQNALHKYHMKGSKARTQIRGGRCRRTKRRRGTKRFTRRR
jgi:hypothetical protein